MDALAIKLICSPGKSCETIPLNIVLLTYGSLSALELGGQLGEDKKSCEAIPLTIVVLTYGSLPALELGG